MTSRPPARHRFEDEDDDDFIPQAPRRDQNLEKGPVGDEGDHQHHKKDHHHHHHSKDHHDPKMSAARPSRGQYGGFGTLPVEMKPQTRAGTSPRREDHQTEFVAHPHVKNKDVDMEEIKAAARSSAAHSYPGAIAVACKGKPKDDMETNKATRPITTHHDDAVAMKTSAMGLAALASTSVTHSTGTARASNVGGLDSVEEAESEKKPHSRVSAVVVQGLSPRNTSDHSSSSDVSSGEVSSPPPPLPGERYSLQATLVADRVTSYNEEADIESQEHSRMRREAKDIADMVHRRIFENTAMAVVKTNEEPALSATKSEGDIQRKKKWILLTVAVLAIAGAIAAGVAIPLSKPPEPTPTPEPSDPLEAFRSVLVSVSEEGLYDPNSLQYKALNWITNDDPANTTVGATPNETIKQRYVAAVLYFALGGENWVNKYNFLTGDPICSWNQNQTYGIICDSTNVRVMTLNMSKNGLSGSIPEEIGYFSDLSAIEMTEGVITGKLPNSLVKLNLLSKLNLTTNALTGTIPEFLYTHAQLKFLSLSYNSFMGTISSSLGTSPQLWSFWVRNNKLTGSIPASVGQSSVLGNVALSGNSLTGTIPDFSMSSPMYHLLLTNNTLGGSIPSSIGNLYNLQYIILDNTTLGGTIPIELGECQNLKYISFTFNQLTGDIGPVINTLPRSLMLLDLSDNNGFSGTIPTSIGTLSNLDFFDLGHNILNGTIPSELGLLSFLEILNLHSNHFTGTVPTTLASLPFLKKLILYDNDLTGSVDALCDINFEVFLANICGQDEINCTCCTHCCDPPPSTFCPELGVR